MTSPGLASEGIRLGRAACVNRPSLKPALWQYGDLMSVILLLVLASLAGLAVGRWWVVGLGMLAGCCVLAIGAWSGTSLTDTPAVFAATVVALGASLGVALRQRLATR
jgi:hypothetical protein